MRRRQTPWPRGRRPTTVTPVWLLFACGSALFAGLTAILAKQGVRATDSTLATALRTPVVLVGAWAMTVLSGSIRELGAVDARSLACLIASGLATGASWLCYFKALQLGDVSRVTPVDKMSTVLTVIMAVALLGEDLGALGALGLVLVTAGTLLMLRGEDLRALARSPAGGGGWLVYAIGSAVFAALTAILGKVGVTAVPSDLGTAIRTGVVLVMAWVMVGVTGRRGGASTGRRGGAGTGRRGGAGTGRRGGASGVPRGEVVWILASGVATCASWLCYFRALQDGPASVVVPVDKLSVLVSVAFSVLVLRERVGVRALVGLAVLVAGTVALAV